jgi:hypothetical protein
MTRTASPLVIIERVLVIAAVLVGWVVSLGQFGTDGWANGGGTGWLLFLSVVASAGGGVALLGRRAGRHGWTALGLFAAALSPTVFAYPMNLGLFVLAVIEVLLLLSRSHRPTELLRGDKSG